MARIGKTVNNVFGSRGSGCSSVLTWTMRVRGQGSHLEYEAAHPGAGRQHEEHVREEHEVALTLVLQGETESHQKQDAA